MVQEKCSLIWKVKVADHCGGYVMQHEPRLDTFGMQPASSSFRFQHSMT